MLDREIGEVEMVPLRPLYLEEQKEFDTLGQCKHNAGVRYIVAFTTRSH